MNASWWAAKWRQGILVLATFACSASIALGQSEVPSEAIAEPRLQITSDPSGVTVEIHGQYDWVGTTPWTIYRPLVGSYRIEAHRPGYRTWTRTIALGSDGLQSLHIELSKKSRFMAGVRSAILPGWGQRYNERTIRSNVLMAACGAAVIGVYTMHLRYDDELEDYEDVEKAYLDSRQIDQIPLLRNLLNEQADQADDAWDDYKVAETIALGVYAINILDALIHGPDKTESFSTKDPTRAANSGVNLGWDATRTAEGSTHLGLRVDF